MQNGSGQNPYYSNPPPPGHVPARPPMAQSTHPHNPNGTVASHGGPPPQAQAPQPIVSRPAFSAPPGTSAHDGEDFVSRLSERLGGRAVFKRLLISTVLFFALFILIAAIKFLNDMNNWREDQIHKFEMALSADANSIARNLDAEIEWMDLALGRQSSPQQIANNVASSRTVLEAALLNGNGKVLADARGAGPQLAQLDRRNFPPNGVAIDSLINDKGVATPVVTRKFGDNFLVVALQPGTLIGDVTGTRALVRDSGRVIDGSPAIASQGPQTFYRISANRLSSAIRGTAKSTVNTHSRNGENVWFGAVQISRSYLSIMDVKKRESNANIMQNLMLFGLLFLGSAWLIYMLMTQLLKQIDAERENNSIEEISRQRYRAAVDGSDGGIWEVDLTRNTAFLSKSLAKTVGLPEKETVLPLPQFLGLFSTQYRDQFYNLLKRAAINGPFEVEMGAESLPIFLSCRGRPTQRDDQTKLVIGMALDITETRGAQARLQSAEARLFDALRSMNDSFVIWDQMDRLVLWNNKFEDFFGFQSGQLESGMAYATVEYPVSYTHLTLPTICSV